MRSILILIVGFVFLGCSDNADKGPLPETNKPEVSSELVNFQIGKHSFAVPRNYLAKKDWQGGKVKLVNLEVIFSDLKGQKKEISSELRKKGYNNKVLVNISEIKGQSNLKKEFEKQRKYFSSKDTPVEQDGLKMSHFTSPQETSMDELYALKKGEQVERYVICYKTNMVPYPNCKASINYAPNLTVEYIFDRQHLAEWPLIEQKVDQFIKSFKKAA